MNTYDFSSDKDYLKGYLKAKSQVHILYSQSIVTFFFPVLAALGLSYILMDVANRLYLYGWITIVITYSIIRYSVLYRYYRSEVTPENATKWLNVFIAGAIISGAIWATAGIILVPYEANDNIDFTLYNGLTMLTVCGLVAGAVISYSVNLAVSASYTLTALLPPAFYLIMLGDKHNSAFGGLILLYCFFIGVAVYRMNGQFRYYLDMEYIKEELNYKHKKLKNMYDELNKKRWK